MIFRRAICFVLLIGLVLSAAGCDSRRQNWSSGLHDLDNVPISATLQPALAAGVAALDRPDPDTPSVHDYTRYRELMVKLRPVETRATAADEIYALWAAEPDNILWLSLARGYRTLLNRPDDLARMLAHPALTDTNTALGAYTAGYTMRRRSERARWYFKAERLQDELSPLNRLQLILKLAAVDRSHGRFVAAVERLIAALPDARHYGGHALESRLWRDIATRLTAADRLDDALHAVTLAAAHARVTADPYQLLQTRIHMATIMAARGEYEPALEHLEAYADEGEARGLPWIVQDSLDKAAQISSEIGDYDHALQLDRRILRHTRQLGDRLNLPRSLASVAHDFRMTGRLDSTYVYLKRAQELVTASGVRANQAKIAELLAGYYCQVGNYAVAESLLVSAFTWNDAYSTRSHRAALLLQMVPSALDMGRPDLAYAWLGEVATVKASLTPHTAGFNDLADFELISARLLAEQGETRLAAESLARARKDVARGGGEGKRWQLLAQEGELARHRHDPRQAEQAFVACLDLALRGRDPRQMARSRFQLGQFYLDQKRYGDAQAMFAPLGNETTFGHAYRAGLTGLLLQGVTYARQGQYAAALQRLDEGLSRLNPHSPPDLKLRLQLAKGRSLSALGHYAEAEAILGDVLETLTESPRLVRFADLRVFRTDLPREAREAMIANTIAGKSVRADRLGGVTLEIAYPGLLGRLGREDAGPALVYFLGAEASWAWRIGPDRVHLRTLPPQDVLQRTFTEVLIDLSQPGRAIDQAALDAAAAMLLGDLPAHWPAGAPLTLVLDDVLRQLPWAAFPLSGGEGVVLDRGPLQEWIPEQPTSATARSAGPGDLTLLAVGCDRTGTSGADALPQLRQAEAEASQVQANWTGGRSSLMTGPDANWPHLLRNGLEDFDVIHLASHAQVHQGLAHRSTLRLAGQAADGTAVATPVTMVAVSRLQLRAELVYLSSCDAGRPIGSGAGDFTAAFLAAGARSVIASTLWVDDEAARFLAERFYIHWQSGASKAAALQAARQDVRRHRPAWAHPSYWAFLRLVGDGS